MILARGVRHRNLNEKPFTSHRSSSSFCKSRLCCCTVGYGIYVLIRLWHQKGLYRSFQKWYQRAADKGLSEAQFDLAFCYLGGQGVDADIDKAHSLCRKAAESGLIIAQFFLGQWLLPQHTEEAIVWLERATSGGLAGAAVQLGLLYQSDKYKGLTWYLCVNGSSALKIWNPDQPRFTWLGFIRVALQARSIMPRRLLHMKRLPNLVSLRPILSYPMHTAEACSDYHQTKRKRTSIRLDFGML